MNGWFNRRLRCCAQPLRLEAALAVARTVGAAKSSAHCGGPRRYHAGPDESHALTVPPLPPTSRAHPDVRAFLSRALPAASLVAQLQSGDDRIASLAVASATGRFTAALERAPLPDWAVGFWTALLASEPLRRPVQAPHWPASFAGLARLPPGCRAATLLHLVSGLDDARAATVLDVPVAAYRLALQRASRALATGATEGVAWQSLADACARQLRAHPQSASTVPAPTTGPRLRRSWLVAGLGACAMALAASFLWPLPNAGDADPRVRAVALPAADAPASMFDAQAATLTHPDFDQLANAALEPVTRELDFNAWYAARMPAVDAPGSPPSSSVSVPTHAAP